MTVLSRLTRLLCTAAVALGLAHAASAQTGACCTTAGVCSQTTASACAATSTFIGAGTTCTPTNQCQGACCSSAGVCSLQAPGNCTGSSTFLGLGAACSPDPCAARLGACCTLQGTCSVTTPAGCTGTNFFLGFSSSTACGTNPCTPAQGGACCSASGFCTITLPTNCATPSSYQGNGVACNASTQAPCNPSGAGACCTGAGVCNVKNSNACTATGESYRGDGTACSPNPCTSLLGACCSTAGVCTSTIQSGCTTTGTSFQGAGTVCSPNPCTALLGACCSNTNTCSSTIGANCTGNNTFLGAGSTCSAGSPSPSCDPAVINGQPVSRPLGACCAANGTCTLTTGAGCSQFLGGGTTCTALPCQSLYGACCNAVGGCTISIPTGCTGTSSFRGAGTTCSTTTCNPLLGACCSGIAACTVTTQGGCTIPGTFVAGQTCSTSPCNALKGACCAPLGACSITTANGCTGTSSFQGPGSTCASVSCTPSQGACCNLDTGSCAVTTAIGCPSPGVWSGGVACAPTNPCAQPAGACCLGTSCFANQSGSFCLAIGGAFFFNNSCSPTPCVRPTVVISQFYTGGGTTNAVYKYDYVELHNTGAQPVTMTNWSLQFGAQTTQTFPTRAIINGTIPAGGYFLIQLASTNLNIGDDLPVAPDFIPPTNVNLDLQAGRLALVSNTNTLPNGCPNPFPVNVVDFVGYGNAAGTGAPSCSEGGTPTGNQGGSAYAFFRKGQGCTDTDQNANDFMIPSAPMPRNSASPAYLCGSTAAGACCVNTACSVVSGPSACAGNFQGEGTVCTPTNPCNPVLGACCNGTVCTYVDQPNCPAPFIYSYGRPCGPVDQCSGACCNGAVCTSTSQAACTTGYFQAGTACVPLPCPVPQVVRSGDIVYGASVAQNADAVQQIRGAGVASPVRVGTWARYNNLQIMRLDNRGGVLHAANGNLLGMDFGTTTNGGVIFNLPTNGNASAGSTLFQFTGPSAPFNLPRSRLGGLSVSPNNDRLACIGYDFARLYVLSYDPGATPGTGAGASITGGAATDSNSFVFGFNITQGTSWLDNNNVLMWVLSDVASVLKLYTVPVTGSGASIAVGTPVERLAVADGKPNSSRFTSIAYNPQLIPGFIFLGSSAFQGISLNTVYVVDIRQPTWQVVKTIDLSGSLQTQRELAIGPDRNLYLSQFAGSGQQATDPLIDVIVLDANGDGVVSDSEIASLNDNVSVDFYLKGNANTSSFNALDIAVSLGACCSGTNCSIQPPNFCTGSLTYRGDGTACSPNPCLVQSVVCCRGATCAVVTAGSCTLSGATAAGAFQAAGTACNVGGNDRQPCCKADYNKVNGVDLLDIFAFLNDWFGNVPYADFNGANGVDLLDIFTFLGAWFAGGC